MIPALKAAIAHYGDDPAWVTVRPPLVELDAAERADLTRRLDAVGFTMPGLAVAAR
jgi:4-hydroxy-tetrahydrodipicolinate synthase